MAIRPRCEHNKRTRLADTSESLVHGKAEQARKSLDLVRRSGEKYPEVLPHSASYCISISTLPVRDHTNHISGACAAGWTIPETWLRCPPR